MDLGLDDTVALVAGSSRGIGFAIARRLLREGARVIVTGRDANCLREAGNALISEAEVGRVLPLQADMTNVNDINRVLTQAVSVFGGSDAVVANVGNGTGPIGWDIGREEWEMALDQNFLGSMALVTAALPHMIARGKGTVTFVSSIVGCESLTAPMPYSAAKASIQSAMKNLARVVGQHGIRVNAVTPGNVLFPGGVWERKLTERKEYFEQYIRSEVPLRRFGRPEEIADAVAFLASERASFITGACLVVDGGQTRSYVQ